MDTITRRVSQAIYNEEGDMLKLYSMFEEKPSDLCERMISALQFISSPEPSIVENNDALYNILEKGPFYREMVENFEKRTLMSQVDILLDKFSEFESTLYMLKIQIDMCRQNTELPSKCSLLVETLAKKCPNVDNVSFFIIVQLGANVFVLQVANGMLICMLHLGEDATLLKTAEFCDFEEYLEQYLQSVPSIDGSLPDRAVPCISSLHLLMVLCADDATAAHDDDITDRVMGALQRLRKAEKVFSIKLIRDHIADMERGSSAIPVADTDEGTALCRHDVILKGEVEIHRDISNDFEISDARLGSSKNIRPSGARAGLAGQVESGGASPVRARQSGEEKSRASIDKTVAIVPLPEVGPNSHARTSHHMENSIVNATIDIRSSLLNELLKSQDAEDVASFGLRAYEAIRKNVFNQREWMSEGDEEEVGDGDDESENGQKQMDVDQDENEDGASIGVDENEIAEVSSPAIRKIETRSSSASGLRKEPQNQLDVILSPSTSLDVGNIAAGRHDDSDGDDSTEEFLYLSSSHGEAKFAKVEGGSRDRSTTTTSRNDTADAVTASERPPSKEERTHERSGGQLVDHMQVSLTHSSPSSLQLEETAPYTTTHRASDVARQVIVPSPLGQTDGSTRRGRESSPEMSPEMAMASPNVPADDVSLIPTILQPDNGADEREEVKLSHVEEKIGDVTSASLKEYERFGAALNEDYPNFTDNDMDDTLCGGHHAQFDRARVHTHQLDISPGVQLLRTDNSYDLLSPQPVHHQPLHTDQSYEARLIESPRYHPLHTDISYENAKVSPFYRRTSPNEAQDGRDISPKSQLSASVQESFQYMHEPYPRESEGHTDPPLVDQQGESCRLQEAESLSNRSLTSESESRTVRQPSSPETLKSSDKKNTASTLSFHSDISGALAREMHKISQRNAERAEERCMKRVGLGKDIFFSLQASYGHRVDKSNRGGNSVARNPAPGQRQMHTPPPTWNVLMQQEVVAASYPDNALHSSREGRLPPYQSGVNEPGITYISSEEQLLAGSPPVQGTHNGGMVFMDTLQYSVDTLPLPPGDGRAIATAAGDAFPNPHPPRSVGSDHGTAPPPGVSALRGIDSDSSLLKSGDSRGSEKKGIITGGGMTFLRNDLFKRHDIGAVGEIRDVDNSLVIPQQDKRNPVHPVSPPQVESRVHFDEGYQPLTDPSTTGTTVRSAREELIRERGKQHARDMWKEKHQGPAVRGSQSARSERRAAIDAHDDNITVVTTKSNFSHHSAFPQNSASPEEAAEVVDERSRRRNKKKGDLIEISFAEKPVGRHATAKSSVVLQREETEKEEERRMAKFELMKKKKMEEAAEREKNRQQSREREGMSAAGYAVREIERRQIGAPPPDDGVVGKEPNSDRNREKLARGSAESTAPQRAKHSHVPGTRAMSGQRVVTKNELTPPKGRGYLNRHVEEEDEDRRIQELEREVESLQTPRSVGGTGVKARASSANPTRRRPSGDNGHPTGDAAPSSVSSRRSASAGRPARPTRKLSNAQQIKNALTHVCLAGSHQSAVREETLDVIDHCTSNSEKDSSLVGGLQFLIVMHQSKMLSFKGLYMVDSQSGVISRLCGRGPKILPAEVIAEYFKYESSSRSFRKLPTLTLNAICDAVSVDPTKLKKYSSK